MQEEKRKSKSPKNQKSPGKDSQDNVNPRKWEGKINKNDMEELDFSKRKSGK